MCGRYALHNHPHVVALQFGLAHEPDYHASYNIAPGMSVLAVRAEANHARTGMALNWGLVPSWAKDPSVGHHMINARVEHLAEKPAFRSAFRRRRCIVPADGFYEWQALGGRKQPYYVRPRENELFGLAGLYETWHGPNTTMHTCTIVTTQANTLMAPLHDRMPFILRIEDYAHWLDPDHPDPPALLRALRPFDPERMMAYPVSTRVNSVKNDDANLVSRSATPAAADSGELF